MSTHVSEAQKRKSIRGVVGAATGNLVEWFDFYIYAMFAPYFQHALASPHMSDSTQLIYVWGVFAASFFMRPIGSWLFGAIADKHGRKHSMMIAILLMAISSFLFAILPTYNSVGEIAPILLLLVRLLQGLSVGGEYGTVATYMSEVGTKNRRGYYASFQYVTLVGGQLIASAVSTIMLYALSKEQLSDGWWRLPFVIGGVCGLLSLLVRSRLEETLSDENKTKHKGESGTLRNLFKEHWREFLTVVGLTGAGSLTFYVLTIYTKTYISHFGTLEDSDVSIMMTIALFFLMCIQPVFGHFADKLGRRKFMLIFSVSLAILTYPVMVWAMPAVKDSAVLLTLLIMSLMFFLSFYTSISGIVKAELFPAHIRALGVGFSYALANAVFGGSAPAIAIWFKDIGHEQAFYVYVVIMLIICFVCSLAIPRESKYFDKEKN
ncbi:MFS transporter [Brackiella oedipodis]|uniref:MFS transporter n=1 Tax=Brackiella oedipodis TaxID=124225 RepID=UPI00048E9BCB|nr:MFS transporter [Brackiella oedipodis]